jgi:hypothetical protein
LEVCINKIILQSSFLWTNVEKKSEEHKIYRITGDLFLSWHEIYTAISARISILDCDEVSLLSAGSTTEEAKEK